jgi:uncharacterized protein
MVRVPLIQIVVNGKDKTQNILKDLSSLTVTDYANNNSDQLDIEVSGQYKRPKSSDEIKVYLGYETLQLIGVFKVTETKKSFKKLQITATGVDFKNNFKVKRNTTYSNVKIVDIVKQIAAKYDLKVKCDFDDLYIKSVAQTNESDMSFLNRLADEYNAIFNLKNETLYFVKKVKNDKKNELLPRYEIDVNECLDEVLITYSEKTFYNSVKVSWHDTKENKRKEIVIPKDAAEPILIYKGNFTSEDEAKAKAKAKLEKANAGIVSGTLSHEGEVIYAGGILKLLNVSEDDFEYNIKSVRHSFTKAGGWSISLDFEN